MTENIIAIILGIIIIIIGIMNCLGHIEMVHSYNRKKITEETRKPYGRAIGTGGIIIGFGVSACSLIEIFFKNDIVYIGLVAMCVIGLGFILYGQIKYNKGVF